MPRNSDTTCRVLLFCIASSTAAVFIRLAPQDFALTRNPAACERFVDHLGLRTLFSIFMGKSKARRMPAVCQADLLSFCCVDWMASTLCDLSQVALHAGT